MTADTAAMLATLNRQRDAFTAARPEPMSQRKDRLKRMIAMMKETGEEQMNVATISEVMDEAAEVPKFKRYAGAMLLADNELRKIIGGTVALNNALNKLQKEINAYLQY